MQGAKGAVAVGVVYVPWAELLLVEEQVGGTVVARGSDQEAGIWPERRAVAVRKAA